MTNSNTKCGDSQLRHSPFLIHLPNIPLILEAMLSEKRFTSQKQIQNNTHLPEPHCWGGSWKWWRFQTSCAPRWWSRFFGVSTSSCNWLPPRWSDSSGTYAHSLQARWKRAKPTSSETNTLIEHIFSDLLSICFDCHSTGCLTHEDEPEPANEIYSRS